MSPPSAPAARIGWFAAFDARYLRAPSVVALIAANLVPVYGVIAWGWDLFGLMVLYWLETGIIGFFAILHMAIAARWLALFLVPFFILHFGGFMAGHMLFLSVIFARERMTGFGDIPGLVWSVVDEQGLWIAVAALFVSHLVSFVLNVLRPMWRTWRAPRPAADGLETRPAQPAQDVMAAPYGRVFLMHVTVIFGAALASIFQTKLAPFLLLIALKTVVDVAAHVRKNFTPAASPA